MALGEPFAAAEGIYIGLNRETEEAYFRGTQSPVMFTSIFVQQWQSWEKLSTPSEERVRALNSQKLSRLGRGGDRGSSRSGTRKGWGSSHCHAVGLGRSQQDPLSRAKSPEEQPHAWVVLEDTYPRQESVRTRNSSGSLTS
jgi:hypothetical protein